MALSMRSILVSPLVPSLDVGRAARQGRCAPREMIVPSNRPHDWSLMVQCGGIRRGGSERCPFAMTQKPALYRPGFTAIFAVMALSSTAALAQVAAPDAPAIQPPAAAPATAVPVDAAPVQTVQIVPAKPKLPELQVATETDTPQIVSDRSVITRSVAARRATSSAALPQPKSFAPAPVKRVTPAPSSPAPIADSTPVAAPVGTTTVSSVSSDQSATITPVKANSNAPTGETGWLLLGGGLVLVAGGAAFAMRRRRIPEENVNTTATARPALAPLATTRFTDGDGNIGASSAPPIATIAQVSPLVSSSRSEAKAPLAPTPRPYEAHATTLNPVLSTVGSTDRNAALEAMIAEAPSEENPFKTRRQRLRRADFLLRTGQAQPATATQTQEQGPELIGDRWSQTAFGGRRMIPVNWKPATR